MAGAAGVVETFAAECCGTVLEPVLEGIAGEVGTELGNENVAEVVVSTFTEQFPDVGVVKGGKGGNFEFEKVVL